MGAETLADVALKKIKQDILVGVYPADSKINIEQMKKIYGIGLTPLREALNRLLSLNWVKVEGLKGFRVTQLSIEEAKDIYRVRVLIEKEALSLSISQGDTQWESEVLACYHQLYKLESDKKFYTKPNILAWMEKYRAFHFSLFKACGSQWLILLDQELFEQSERYRYCRLADVNDFSSVMKKKANAHQKMVKYILAREKRKAVEHHLQQLKNTVDDLISGAFTR